MKKIYQAPIAQKFLIEAQNMLASSPTKIDVVEDGEFDASNSYSNRKGWNSDIWGTMKEE